MHTRQPEVLIIGGGIAGLWLLDELRRKGYDVLLVEKTALGHGQTIAAQGILHGGLKHALVGRLGGYVDALKGMPAIWRACLDGTREPNLQYVERRGDVCYCWRTDTFASTLGQLGARFGLRTGLTSVERNERPIPLVNAPGDVFRLDEQVVNPQSLLLTLQERNLHHLMLGTWDGEHVEHAGRRVHMQPHRVVYTAGAGNTGSRFLPLPILTLRGDLPTLNGFCIDGAKAKVIVTTQRFSEHHAVWQVASEMENDIWQELREALPRFTWPNVESRLTIAMRAEGGDGTRANDVTVTIQDKIITAWPTKLVLAPRLVEQVRRLLPDPWPEKHCGSIILDWPRPEVAPFPWL